MELGALDNCPKDLLECTSTCRQLEETEELIAQKYWDSYPKELNPSLKLNISFVLEMKGEKHIDFEIESEVGDPMGGQEIRGQEDRER
jgi:hypothetical protein